MTLHYVDVNDKGELSKCQMLFESKFHSTQSCSYARSSKEEQLQLERKRVMMCGIAAFDYVAPGNFAFSSSGSVFRCHDEFPLGCADQGVFPEEVRITEQNRRTRLDPQMCPFDPNITAYISHNDIWVYNWASGHELRLTTVHESDATLSAGIPCYVTQEEFNRFSGFWWAPRSTADSVDMRSTSPPRTRSPVGSREENQPIRYSILYEVVDESDVEVVELPNATGGVEEYHFPRAGTPNAKSSLRLVSFSVASNGTFVDISYAQISNPFIDAAEYVLRAGWTPDARHIWAQLLNRQQDTLQLLLVRVQRKSYDKLASSGASYGASAMETEPKMNLLPSEINDDGLITHAVLLLEEKSSVWINVHDVLGFLSNESLPPQTVTMSGVTVSSSPTSEGSRDVPLCDGGDTIMENGLGAEHYWDSTANVAPLAQDPCQDQGDRYQQLQQKQHQRANQIRTSSSPQILEFVWASEATGFRHLYLYRIDLETGMCIERRPLTGGDWEVSDKYVWIDNQRRLVYFIGLKDSPLEKQLYVVSLDETLGEIQCLTSLGASYQAFVNPECSLVVTIESHLAQPPFARLYRLVTNDSDVGVRCAGGDTDTVILKQQEATSIRRPGGLREYMPQLQLIGNLMEPASVDERYRVPELFQHQLSSGDTVFGVIFKPRSLDESRPYKFPTVLTIYGGPEVQLVTNSFKGMRHLRQHLLSSEDFCVVTMDCRGSRNRGVAFESHLKGRMGQVEIQDQVEVLQWLAEDRGYMDMSRVAIHGWSYGGYLSLMALAQRPDIFKLAVAGAPVTQWNLYDTGYTERYMGLPEANREGYHRGSVLSHVSQFPDEEGRLLLIHGLMDENVHFTHTTSLVQALVKAGKPYRLQVYPQERHSLRHLATSEHYETTLLSFLQDNL